RRACTPETRSEIIGKLKAWAKDTFTESSPIFWLSGLAGTGKSTIAYTVCQYLKEENLLGASFFCSRNDPNARDRKNIIPSIVTQLLHCGGALFATALCALPLGTILPDNKQHVNELLVQPWLRARASEPDPRKRHQHLVVVIDALDEVENDGPELVAELIRALLAQDTRLQGIKFLLTSRPQPKIVAECRPIDHRAIYSTEQISPDDATDDIRRYLRVELPQLHEKYPHSVESIVKHCAGLFIIAATVVRYLDPPNDPLSLPQQKKRLADFENMNVALPKANKHEFRVDSLYRVVLDQALPIEGGDEHEYAKRVMYAVVTARQPLTVSELAPLVALHSEPDEWTDTDAVTIIIHRFHAVLYTSGHDHRVRTYHKSFRDFLLSTVRCNAHAEAASDYFYYRTTTCLQVMEKALRFNMGGFPSSYPLDIDDQDLAKRIKMNINKELEYACRFWATHLSSLRHENERNIREALVHFFRLKVLFWMESMHLLKIDCRPSMHLARDWARHLKPQNKDLNVLMAAVDMLWASFINNTTSQSTPHLYISSLATVLAMSAMRSISLPDWQSSFPGLPTVKCTGILHEPSLLIIQREGHNASVHSVAFSPDGMRIASGSDDLTTVRIWDATTGTQVAKMKGHGDSVLSVAFSPDGTQIASSSGDETMGIWDATTGAEVAMMEGHESCVYSVAFSPDGMRIASGSADLTVRIWDATTGTQVAKMKGHGDSVLSVAFSPDGTQIASSSGDETMGIWDATTGAKVAMMEGHGDSVSSVAFSPDGMRIASGSADLTVRIWDATTGTQVAMMEGHKSCVYSVAFSPDGTQIASGSDDSTVRIWDAATGIPVAKMEGHDSKFRSVAFSPD
ncbi:WD40-repeat-containing domain protein, partial [Pterulicium gracile]